MSSLYYQTKPQSYFTHPRPDVISLIPINPQQKLMEVGAGAGNMLLHIKQHNIAGEVMGIELVEIPGSSQQHELIDYFQVGDVEKEELKAPKDYFDIIICADVLEHLADPWKVIEKLSCHLKKDGLLIVSIPNIREWKTQYRILFGADFRYDPAGGILDKTHLRFFCKKNMRQLLTTDKLEPIWSKPNFMMKVLPEGKKRRVFNRLSFGLFQDLLTVQYLWIARRK